MSSTPCGTGSSKAADKIIKDHPNPHRLKLFLQLEGKNLGIVTPEADLATAADEVMTCFRRNTHYGLKILTFSP